ncbi:MAG: hypothetical protein GX573_27110 [Chloroflexi bacterium]|nr:hypothetical protein [Chloroflexota bacterium]
MAQFSLIKTPAGRRLRIEGELPDGFQGEAQGGAWLCPLDAGNAAALRRHLPWTAPVPVGLRKSVGCGDRLGLATPGHLLAVRAGDMFPVLAQQSIREMTRSRRTPQQVLDDATWGVFEADYRDGFGSDADHLKNTESIDRCIAAGYIGFTLDPGDHVDNAAHTDDPAALQAKYAALPWDALETTPNDLRQRYLGPSLAGAMSEQMLLRAACKYGPALAAAVQLARHIAAGMDGRPYDLEISVDETETPTSPAEHYFIASELLRLGVPFQGLAPRFVGRFEKGVDYIGDLAAFEADFSQHAHIARELGPYKLSIHSGSDKFSIYPIIARHCGEYVHLKTAGTSWVEALRVIAQCEPALFREILAFALDCYPTDRASYHVSAVCERVSYDLDDAGLPGLLDHFDARQALHVTFGSVLDRFREPIYAALSAHEDTYYEVLRQHFNRHIGPFVAPA